MKRAFLISVFFSVILHASGQETTYLSTLKATHERLRVLETQRHDYRKPKPGLPPAQEEERLRLVGQLLTDDPVWTLAQQIQADISALVAIRPQLPADVATLDALKELLAITAGFEERATTRAQAEQFAVSLRQFVARRNAAGAKTWATSQ